MEASLTAGGELRERDRHSRYIVVTQIHWLCVAVERIVHVVVGMVTRGNRSYDDWRWTCRWLSCRGRREGGKGEGGEGGRS